MKKSYLLFIFIIICKLGFAQDKSTEKADKLFNTYQYVSAIGEYLALAENKNPYIYSQLAASYYTIFNPEEASKWYAKAIESKAKLKSEDYFSYAQALKSLSNYKEANNQMETFAKLATNDSRAVDFKKNSEYISDLNNQKKLFDVAETIIKEKDQSYFGAFLTNDNTLYFASTNNKAKKTDKWTDLPYLDIFKATRNQNGTLTEIKEVSELNTPYHDGPVSISADGNTMYFARDGHSEGQYQRNKSNNIKVGQQGIYKATKSENKWTNIIALPINSINYSVTNPSLSVDGKTLYFASNMPGGLGESDIWKISINGENYGNPENLGSLINTQGKENFPFITDDNTLYFASTGKQGFGGFDIFKINLNSKDEAQNVGKPVNSEKDDFALSFNKKANVGYFSSNRNGFDAIFSALPICKSQTLIVVTDKKTGAKITNASVSIVDSKGKTIQTVQSNDLGVVNYEIECNTKYNFLVSANNFEQANFPLEKTTSNESVIKAQLNPSEAIITDKEVILNNVYFEFDKSNITAQGSNELNKLVTAMNDYPSMIILVKSHTDSKGKPDYNLNLSEQRAQSTVQYIISKGISKDRISGKGYGSNEPKVNCNQNCTDEDDAQNRRSEFLIIKK